MILITGANGFIGKHLIQELLKNYSMDDIMVLSSSKHNFLKTVTYKEGRYQNSDNDGKENFEKVQIIIHAGAFTPKNSSMADDMKNTQLNIDNVYDLANFSFPRLKKIIFLSTLDVYQITGVVNENTKNNPASLYGWSKLYGEQIIKKIAQKRNLDYQIFRVGHVYGPGEESYEKIIPITMHRILNNQNAMIYGTGNELRNFIFVEDVVKVIVGAINKVATEKVINIVGEQSVSINNLIKSIINISEKKVGVEYIKTDFTGIDYVFDNSILIKNFEITYTSLDKGLRQEWEHLKEIK